MPQLEITLKGHLLVGGNQSGGLGVDLATARRFDGSRWIPYIPATAVRGAVRIQLEALLRGAGREGSGPYPEIPSGKLDPVARLFGYSGPAGRRDGAHEGQLRFGDALPVDSAAALHALVVRPGLELDDRTASAAERKLFFREVAEVAAEPLVFLASIDPGDATEQDCKDLRAAIETTEAVGAGKSKGGGAITMRWLEGAAPAPARVSGPAGASRARLTFTLTEPAHFGDGGPFANHHATRSFIPGATVRGAIAWALLRAGKAVAEDPCFRALFLDSESPVSFGDALLIEGSGLEAIVRPATRRHLRGGKKRDDRLARELARARVNQVLLDSGHGLYLREDDGDDRFETDPARPTEGLIRRTRTRVSIDRRKGVAADGRLFSIEQLEPWLIQKDGREEAPGPQAPLPVRFVSTVEGRAGLSAEAFELLRSVEGLPILIGAGRNHGLGLVQLDVELEESPTTSPTREHVLTLAAQVDAWADRLARRAGVTIDRAGDRLLLALTAVADFVPSNPGERHPLAEPEVVALGLAGQPVRVLLNPGSSGGYDQRPGHAPLKDLVPALGAGSVFVYELNHDLLLDRIDELAAVLRRGMGRRVECGCGRFEVFRPVSDKELGG